MARSQNGYIVLGKDSSLLYDWVVPGVNRYFRLRQGPVGFILLHFTLWYHERVQPLNIFGDPWDEWGWAYREIADSEVIAREPCVVVEVTSPSTGRIDRGEKLHAYRQIPSLLSYLIVDHRRRRIERRWREEPDREWQREEIMAEGSVVVPCLDVEASLDDVYRRVELPAAGDPEPTGYEV